MVAMCCFIWPPALQLWSGRKADRQAGGWAGRQADWLAEKNRVSVNFYILVSYKDQYCILEVIIKESINLDINKV